MTISVRRKPRIPLEELCRLPSFFLPVVSWSTDKVAFYWDTTGRVELHLMDLATRAVRQLSHGEVPRALRAGFVWSRDDRSIVFAKDEAGNEQHDLHAIDVATGAVARLTHDPTAQEFPVRFSPDGEWLTVLSNRRSAASPDQPGQLNIWKVRPDGSDYTQLTRFAFPVFSGAEWSEDGEWITANTNDDPSDLKNLDGYILRPDGSDLRKVFSVKAGAKDFIAAWHPDGRRLAVTSDASGQPRAGIFDLESAQTRWLSPDDVEEHALRFSRDGRLLACLRNRESQIRPIVYEVETGTARELDLPPGLAYDPQFSEHDTKLLIIHSTDVTRPSLIAYDLATDRAETLVPAEYGSVDRAIFVEASHIAYPTFDGKDIPALLYRPRDIREGERLPAIVHVHGGPTAQFFRGFDPFAQFLADRGFVVLEPNIRGSTGYGVAFRDAALRDWGGADLEDVAAGAAHLRSLPYVDGDRLVVFGGSYGGYMTFMAATKKPELWRAAVAWVGVSDLHRLYEKSMEHFKYYFRSQMGDPRENAALWSDRSAINFAAGLRAKLLMVHGVNDPRCPLEQSTIFRDRLLELGRREGVDFEYVELADEGHGSNDIAQKIRTFTILADYLDRVL
ncbi:MAG: S9 family peptidase [Candidatus Limnocylindria bacterium]